MGHGSAHVNDDEEDDSPVEEVSPVKPKKPSRRAARAKKNDPKEPPKEWTVEEKIALCQACSSRGYDSILSKWKNRVHPRIGAFCAIINNVEDNHESGSNDLDVFQKACAEYKMIYKQYFTLEHCYNILKDHQGCLGTRKITSCGIQFLGSDKLVSWSSKKQDCTSTSTVEAEYVSLFACCAQVLWMRTQLTDYGFYFDKIPMYCDSKAAIAISCNPVQHSRTKHIDLADLFTKALSQDRFHYLVRLLGMRCLTPPKLEALTNESA
ncbi:hypothetical protein Tco_1546690 [Tanacetum coccineum]